MNVTITKRVAGFLSLTAACFLFLLTSHRCIAQDIHFSQFYHAPLHLNPALAGIFNGDSRFAGTYRSQWYAARVPYTTFTGMADQKFYNKKWKKATIGAGALFHYDVAGDGRLGNLGLSLGGNYIFGLDGENFLSLGVQAGIFQRSFNPNELTFDNQFNGEIFVPNSVTGENFQRTNKVFGDLNVGLNWHGQQLHRRSRLDVGVALYHLTRPNQSFDEVEVSRLDNRLSMYLLPTVQIGSKLDLLLHGMAQLQGSYVEAFGGGGFRWHLSQRRTREMAVQLTGSYRFNSIGDAFIPAVEFHYNSWIVGFSYDVNVSDYSVATNRYGGPELVVRYHVVNVKPLNRFKICPII